MHYVKQFDINGVATKQVACIELHGKPNAATEGCIGVLGIDMDSPTHDVYKCSAVNGSIYTWELLSSGMSIISATISGEGVASVQFNYADLRTPAMYVVKKGDLILDKEGYLYQIDSLNSTYCMASYSGTRIAHYGWSAYDLAKNNGYEGTEEEWLMSLEGEPGAYLGTEEPTDPDVMVWVDPSGEAVVVKSAYEYAVEGGYTGTEEEFAGLLANGVDKNKITLGLYTDGLIYIFVDGVPVGTGIALPEGGVSGDVVGNLDSENNIILTGNLADGTYTIKYGMENGNTVNIGNLVLDSNVYYAVTKNLTNCTINNSATRVTDGANYSATISANEGYELKSVVVTMGGTNVSVTNGVINIAKVTGNIVITAAAEKAVTMVNQIPISTNKDGSLYVGTNGEKGYKTGYRLSLSSGNESALANYEVTGFIPVKVNDTIRVKNIDLTQDNYTNITFYDSNKTAYNGGSSTYGVSLGALLSTHGTEQNGVSTLTFKTGVGFNGIDNKMAYIRISSKSITDASILTVNQEIV